MTVTATDELTEHEFAVEIPCEHVWHWKIRGDPPAEWSTEAICPSCAVRFSSFLCDPDLQANLETRALLCPRCEVLSPTGDWIVNFVPITEAMRRAS